MRRGAPPVALDVAPRTGWRAAVATLATLAIAALVAACALDEMRRADPAWIGGTLAGVAVCAALAASLWPRARGRLAFDGAGWHWQPAGASEAAPVELEAAVDLGAAILLRLTSSGRRPLWLAVGRDGDAGRWHLVRCAIYSARPGPAPSAVDAPRH